MTDRKIELIIGALLHDIGKVMYRQGNERVKHSESGARFLENDADFNNKAILNSVRYHHGYALKNAGIENDDLAYITYIADNISAGLDRKDNPDGEEGYEMEMPLSPVFNVLNGNHANNYYSAKLFGKDDKINYPSKNKVEFDSSFYSDVISNIRRCLKGSDWNNEYLNSLISVLEATLTYVPSSTSKRQFADISLFDHVKLTAAVASCIYDYLEENGESNYKDCLFKKANDFYAKKCFRLYSMDVSGIQKYIYTIDSKEALKNLRARSFYLEIMMEHIVDELLDRLELSRANLIYLGGGHCYILLPATKKAEAVVAEYENALNRWLLETFDVSLYVASGYSDCCANSLSNNPEGSYSEVFKELSDMVSKKKNSRYSAEQIIKLNKRNINDHTRECKVCRRSDNLVIRRHSDAQDEYICKVCAEIINFSNLIMDEGKKFYSVSTTEKGLPLPFGRYLTAKTEEELRKSMEDETHVRAYSKNGAWIGEGLSTNLWVADYASEEKTFEELSAAAEGRGAIDRIGILRADVDNLGKAFVSGFEENKCVSLSRTATLSRQLSMFFKYHIKSILSNPEYHIDRIKVNYDNHKRNAVVVYSGGDDLFIVGAWDDVLELSIDIRNAFKKYTCGTLSISAGIGLYDSGYPVHASAKEVAKLEDMSKRKDGKDSLTFLTDGRMHTESKNDRDIKIGDTTYKWDDFSQKVVGEKYQCIEDYLADTPEHGMSMLYKILELVRSQDESEDDADKRMAKLNIARFVYLLARLAPSEKDNSPEGKIKKEKYNKFSENMYKWIKDKDDCRQLKNAINLYAYIYRNRNKEDK